MSTTRNVLDQFKELPSGQPILFGHILNKLYARSVTLKKVNEWASMENEKNGFSPVKYPVIRKCDSILKRRRANTCSVGNLTQYCKQEAHSWSNMQSSIITPPVSPDNSSDPPPSTSSAPLSDSTLPISPPLSAGPSPTINPTPSTSPALNGGPIPSGTPQLFSDSLTPISPPLTDSSPTISPTLPSPTLSSSVLPKGPSTDATPSIKTGNSTKNRSLNYTTPSASAPYAPCPEHTGSGSDCKSCVNYTELIAKTGREIKEITRKIAIVNEKTTWLKKREAELLELEKILDSSSEEEMSELEDSGMEDADEEMSKKITTACLSNGVAEDDVPNLVKSLFAVIKKHR